MAWNHLVSMDERPPQNDKEERWKWGRSPWLPKLIQTKGFLPSEFSVRNNLLQHLTSHLGRAVLSSAPPNVKSFKCFLEQQELLTRGPFFYWWTALETGLEGEWPDSNKTPSDQPHWIWTHYSSSPFSSWLTMSKCPPQIIYMGMDLWILVNCYRLKCLSIHCRDELFIKKNGLFWLMTPGPGKAELGQQHLFCFPSSLPASLPQWWGCEDRHT